MVLDFGFTAQQWLRTYTFSLLFNILFVEVLTFLKPLGDNKAVILEDDEQNKDRRQVASHPGGLWSIQLQLFAYATQR
ncbi:unnamed protein product [Coffea canephora]|uniref:Plant PDR ABC transporter associated domain-containing protein n=1 Tax=Coffea canephora TaxID=49390 RepID=A0A068VBB6_COFCA|nr:unnamed protein product [Coffea canephora]